MAISVISVSSDSFEDSVGTPAGRAIMFGSIPTIILDTTPVITPPTTQTYNTVIPTETPIITPTIPPSPDYTPALFSPDDSARYSSSDSSSDHSGASSDSSSRHSLSDHSLPDLPSTSAGPSRKRHVEVGPRETRVERVTHPVMPEGVPEPAQEGAVDVTYETLGDLVQRFHDHTEATSRSHCSHLDRSSTGHRLLLPTPLHTPPVVHLCCHHSMSPSSVVCSFADRMMVYNYLERRQLTATLILTYRRLATSGNSDGTTTISLTCFSVQANSLTMDGNELIVELPDKDLYHLQSTLKELQVSMSILSMIIFACGDSNEPSSHKKVHRRHRRSSRGVLFGSTTGGDAGGGGGCGGGGGKEDDDDAYLVKILKNIEDKNHD
nr:hypothetical protein [Tanacetum cinerariifolium]